VTYANSAAADYLGYSLDELRGFEILSLFAPRSEAPPAEALRAGETLAYEAVATHRDGRSLPIEVHAKLIEMAPQPSVQWILRDVSERLALDELRRDLTSMILRLLGNVISNWRCWKVRRSIRMRRRLRHPMPFARAGDYRAWSVAARSGAAPRPEAVHQTGPSALIVEATKVISGRPRPVKFNRKAADGRNGRRMSGRS
jgi:PAS domain S-box-containing protein